MSKRPKSGRCACGKKTSRYLGCIVQHLPKPKGGWTSTTVQWFFQCLKCSKAEEWIGTPKLNL